MKIVIETIPHEKQRYDTVGDWWFYAPDQLHVNVSEMGNYHYEMLVGLHEVVEALLCNERNIPEKAITEFDEAFEAKRQPGNVDEPGDDPAAPYRREHFFATSIERLIAAELAVDWTAYDDAVNAL